MPMNHYFSTDPIDDTIHELEIELERINATDVDFVKLEIMTLLKIMALKEMQKQIKTLTEENEELKDTIKLLKKLNSL